MLQKSMFSQILRPDSLSAIISGSTARSLALINMLTKISNSPILLKLALEKKKMVAKQDGPDVVTETALEQALTLVPGRARPEDFSLSGAHCFLLDLCLMLMSSDLIFKGKLTALADLLRTIRKVSIVIHSSITNKLILTP